MMRVVVAWLSLVVTLGTIGCSDSRGGEGMPAGTGAPPSVDAAVTPTLVARLPATPTPTPPPDPLAPVPSDKVPGVVVPAGAVLVSFTPATTAEDASADFAMDGVDSDALFDWFREEMPLHGWDEGEDRGGSLIFLHETEISARFASEGLKRTATVLFDTVDAPEGGASFTLLVEAPADDA